MAISDCARHALWFRYLFQDLDINVKGVNLSFANDTVELFNDNRGTVFLTKEPVINDRSKHIDIRYHFIRDHVRLGNITTSHVPTTAMPADFLTKSLSPEIFERCCHQIQFL